MTLELDGTKFVIAMWMIPLDRPKDTHGRTYDSGDWMATLYKEDGKPDLSCSMRFRYHVDDKAHDSEDVKSWIDGSFPGKTEIQVMKTVGEIAEKIASVSRGRRPEIHKILIRSANPDVILKRMSAEPFFHIRGPDDEEKKP